MIKNQLHRITGEKPSAPIEESWPPPPHDPREREVVFMIDDWEVRAFAEGDVRHRYFAPRGFLHVQLWHPKRRVSILTPSRLTAGRFEAFPITGWKYASENFAKVAGLIRSLHGVDAPTRARVESLHRWYVMPKEVSQVYFTKQHNDGSEEDAHT